MPVATAQRFNKNNPCPVCGGHNNLPRHQKKRCGGWISEDGNYCYCTREEFAGGLVKKIGSNSYTHYLHGLCNCGVRHGPDLPPLLDFNDYRPGSIASKNGFQEPAKVEPPRPRVQETPKKRAAKVSYFNYLDEDGVLLFQVVREDFGPKDKNFWQRRPRTDMAEGWETGLGGMEPVLYRLPELARADKDKTVFIVEGEKHVDRLISLGLVATCNPMGANKWRPSYSQALKGRRVCILPDNDEPGRLHRDLVINQLAGLARSIQVLGLDGLPEGGDVLDWLDAGHNVEELIALAGKAETHHAELYELLTYEDLCNLPEPSWLVKPELVKGYLTCVYGPPHTGKSFLALHYALEVAQEFPVVYLIGENATGYKHRVKSWCDYYGKTPGQIRFIKQPVQLLDMQQVAKLQITLDGVKPALVIIDTLSKSYAGGDENDARDMRTFAMACDSLRRLFECTVLVVHHTSRAGGNPRGSSVIEGDFDTLIEISKTEEKGIVKVECKKQKDAPTFEPKQMKIQPTNEGAMDFSSSCVIIPAGDGSVETHGQVFSELSMKILEVLGMPANKNGESFAGLMNTLAVDYYKNPAAKQQWYRALKELIPTYVVQPKDRGAYFITPAGLDLLVQGSLGPDNAELF